MFTNLFSVFQSAFGEADSAPDPGAELKRRISTAPPSQIEALAANEHLRGFLGALVWHHEEGRVAEHEWRSIAGFLMGERVALPRSVAHLGVQWARAAESAVVLASLLQPRLWRADEPSENIVARFRVVWKHLKQQASEESWLSHGFKVEFQELCRDHAVGPLDRVEVVDIATMKLGPMHGDQLQACLERIARLRGLLPSEVYPCIHDVLTRVANEARWQLDLFSLSDDGVEVATGHPVAV